IYPPDLSTEETAIHIATQKARAIQHKVPADSIILAADTIVVLNNKIINKPADREEAIRILTQLSGNLHKVITGVVIKKGNKEVVFADTTDVNFHELSREQIEFYVDKYQPYDKAGAYAIQEW